MREVLESMIFFMYTFGNFSAFKMPKKVVLYIFQQPSLCRIYIQQCFLGVVHLLCQTIFAFSGSPPPLSYCITIWITLPPPTCVISLNKFLSSANEVSTGPTCQFLYVCLYVCMFSGLSFEASDWVIYSLLVVVLAPSLFNQVF